MGSPKALPSFVPSALLAAVLAGSARSHLQPPADRTACGACETYGTGPSHFPSNGRRSGPDVALAQLRLSRFLQLWCANVARGIRRFPLGFVHSLLPDTEPDRQIPAPPPVPSCQTW